MSHLGEFLPPLAAFAVYSIGYGLRARALARQRRPVAGWRVAAFTAGVLIVTLVQLPPLDGLADSVLIAHMTQHILIGDVASFLVVIGLTGPLLAPWLALRVPRGLRALGHPIAAFTLWALDLYVWHVPLLYQLAIRRDLIHALEHTCLFWFGFLLWFSLLGPLPKPAWFGNWAKLGYVVGVRLAGTSACVVANSLRLRSFAKRGRASPSRPARRRYAAIAAAAIVPAVLLATVVLAAPETFVASRGTSPRAPAHGSVNPAPTPHR